MSSGLCVFILSLFSHVGRCVLHFFQDIGRLVLLVASSLTQGFSSRTNLKNGLCFFLSFTLRSLGLGLVMTAFAGMVLALQMYLGLWRFGEIALQEIPGLIALAMAREMSPLLIGLMGASKLGSSSAAEVGAMKISDQLKVLISLGRPPLGYVAFPKILGGILSIPCLVFLGNLGGILGGYILAVFKFDQDPTRYLQATWSLLAPIDLWSGLLKGSIFGVCIAAIGCYQGIKTQHGALGVGSHTMKAVVQSSVLVLILNYGLSLALF